MNRIIESFPAFEDKLAIINLHFHFGTANMLNEYIKKQTSYATIQISNRPGILHALRKSRLSCPVAATLNTDSAAPMVLAKQAATPFAVS